VSLLEQVVKIWEQTLAEGHPYRLASQYMLARAYEANGQVKEAVSLLAQVIKIQEQTLAEDHPSRLASLHTLRGAYLANGQVEEALSLLEQVVNKLFERKMGNMQPAQSTSKQK
jgi:tetratricopeptide (TPR) repeat protein